MLVTMLLLGLLIGYLWGNFVCSKFGKVARYEVALKDVANGCQHPAKLAEYALENS